MTRIDGDDGWALVSVLWVVAMLAMMAAATQLLLLTTAKGERRVMDHAQAEAALDAGLTRAVLGIGDERLDQRWPVDGTERLFTFDGMQIHIKVQDQLGLIDLNAADGSMIDQLLQSAGLTSDQAQTMTDRILDWRSTTALKSLHGASDADYAAAGLPYHQRHGPFQSVAELRLVLGMTSELYAKIAPALTVYSNRPAFDPNLAPEQALHALYINAPDQVAAILDARRGTSAPNPQGNSVAGTLNPTLPLAGRCFSIAEVIERGKRHYTRTVVVELTGDDEHPYLTLAWQ